MSKHIPMIESLVIAHDSNGTVNVVYTYSSENGHSSEVFEVGNQCPALTSIGRAIIDLSKASDALAASREPLSRVKCEHAFCGLPIQRVGTAWYHQTRPDIDQLHKPVVRQA